jgi:hypothetical protein
LSNCQSRKIRPEAGVRNSAGAIKASIIKTSTIVGLYHMTEKKIDDPPNLNKDRCYTKFGGIDRKTST